MKIKKNDAPSTSNAENHPERLVTFTAPLDIILVDEKTGALIERPISTMTIDVTTRHVISVYISQS